MEEPQMYKSLWLALLLTTSVCAVADEPARTITVSGNGVARVEPDRATVSMSIVAREPTVAAAQKSAAEVAGKVLDLADRLDVDLDRIDTTGASVRPNYVWNRQKEEQELRGYIAERQIVVQLDDLEQLGEVIEGAVEAGVNQVSPPQLDSSRRKAAYREALKAAAADAKSNAEQLAATLGARLGRVMSIQAGTKSPRPPVPTVAMRAMAAEADAFASYNPANLDFEAVVTVVFELTD
jgi:uncharacterized protein YggE